MSEEFKLWAHQEKAVQKYGRNINNFALFFEVGTGKTATALHMINKSMKGKAIQIKSPNKFCIPSGPIVIVSPIITLENWRREVLRHLLGASDKHVHVLKGTANHREMQIHKALVSMKITKAEYPCVIITNYETLNMPAVLEALMSHPISYVIFDEAHKVKDFQAKRTKHAIKLADFARRRFILTGTPVLNSPLDLFSQFRVLDGGETFGKNFYAFRATYFYDKNANMAKKNYFPKWVIKKGADKEINHKIRLVSAQAKKSECLDLPPYVRVELPVELGGQQREHYEALKKDFITYMQGGACVVTLAITKLLRLQQIISGHLPIESETGEQKVVHFERTPRAEALYDLLCSIKESKGKVLVWAVFKHDYEVIRAVFKRAKMDYVEVHGEVATKDKFKAVDEFNNNPKITAFLGHPGSGGVGINLIAANYTIFYSRTFSLEQDLQAEARNYRGGSEIHAKITRYDIIAKDTLDAEIAKRLVQKVEMSESILRDIANVL